MGIWLLAIELSLVTVVGLAFWFSLFGKTSRRWLYLPLSLICLAGPAIGIGVLWWPSYERHFYEHNPVAYFWQVALLACATAAGGLGLLVYGTLRSDGRLVAGRWPTIRLLLAWIASLLVQGLTVYILDCRAHVLAVQTRSELAEQLSSLTGPMPADSDNAALLYAEPFKRLPELLEQYDLERQSKALAARQAERQRLATQPSTRPDDDADDPALPDIFRPGPSLVSAWSLLENEHAGEAETLELLSQLEPVLPAIRQAATRPSCRFTTPPRLPDTINVDLKYLNGFPLATRSLRAHAIEMARRGKMDVAIEDIIAMQRMARHLDQTMPCVIVAVVRAAMHAQTYEALVSVLPYSRQAPTLPPDFLPDEAAFLHTFERNLRGEEILCIGSILNYANGSIGQGVPASSALLYRILYLRQDVQASRTYRIVERDLLWGRKPSRILPYKSLEFVDGSWLLGVFLPYSYTAQTRNSMAEANARQARIALALTHYRLKNNSYPATLEALVPQWLPSIPADPFDGKPMRYRLDGNDAIIYSVGDNRKDDGGAIKDIEQKKALDVGFRLQRQGTASANN